jgi:hypothetical protein
MWRTIVKDGFYSSCLESMPPFGTYLGHDAIITEPHFLHKTRESALTLAT